MVWTYLKWGFILIYLTCPWWAMWLEISCTAGREVTVWVAMLTAAFSVYCTIFVQVLHRYIINKQVRKSPCWWTTGPILAGRAGYGMENKFKSRIRCQINFDSGSNQGRVHLHVKGYWYFFKALAPLAKLFIDTSVQNMCLIKHKVFPGQRTFQHFLSECKSLKLIDIVY